MPEAGKLLRAFMESYAELKPDELRSQLLDLRETVSDLEDENRRLREENMELSETLRRRKALEYHDGGYYVYHVDVEVGPICPECFAEKGLTYRLETSSKGAHCATCGKYYAGVKASIEGPRSRVG